ncbi:MAG TPA: hypothetical protein V6C72_08780, partial [Chroococcales cyanobacterium]
ISDDLTGNRPMQMTRPEQKPGMTMTRTEARSDSAGEGSTAAMEKFEQLRQRAVIQNKDGQDYVFHELRARLAQLKSKGQIDPDWEVIPTQAGSPADKIGADYLLINTRTEDVHMLDATSNSEKFDNPREHNVPVLREGGLIYFEPKWFDQLGHLKTDTDEPFEIQSGVRNFRADLNAQLRELANTESPFKLGEMPLPQITVADPVQAKAQIDQYLDWVKRNVDEPNVDDYIATVRKASKHLDITMRTTSEPQFNERVGRETDRAVLTWAINKLMGREPVDAASKAKSDVYFHAKSGHIVMRAEDGSNVDAGPVGPILQASRSHLLSTDALEEMVKPKQLEQIRAKYPKMTDQQIRNQLANIITNGANEIASGGRLGNGRPKIIDQVVNRLQGQPEDVLMGRVVAKPAAKPVDQPAAPPAVPKNVQLVADYVGNVWRQEGFTPLTADGHPDPLDVELVLDQMIQDPARSALKPGLEALLEAFQKQSPVAIMAIENALRTDGIVANRPGPTSTSGQSGPAPR